MREESGDSKGVGFCRIDSEKLCSRIIQECNSKPFPGRFNVKKKKNFSVNFSINIFNTLEHADKTRCIVVKLADSSGFFKSNATRTRLNHSLNSSGVSMNGSSLNETNPMRDMLMLNSSHASGHNNNTGGPCHHQSQYIDQYVRLNIIRVKRV